MTQQVDRNNDELFRQLVDNAPDAMVVVDSEGRILLVNQPTEALFGYARADLLGQPVELLIPDGLRASPTETRVPLTAPPSSSPLGSASVLSGRRKDGAEIQIELRLSSLIVDGRQLVAGAIRAVGERGRAEHVFRALIEAAPDAMVIADARGKIVLVNAQAERLFGYERAELVEAPIERLIPARYHPGHAAHRAGYGHEPRARGMGADLELFAQHKEGREFPVEVSLSPLHTASGLLVSAAIRDISARRRVEQVAKIASERLSSAVESFHGMLALYDAEGRLTLCNSTWRDAFAPIVSGPLVGSSYPHLVEACLACGFFASSEDAASLRERLLEHHQQPTAALDLRIATGATWRLTSRRTLEGGVISTLIDVSDDARLEAELRSARAEAEAASSAKSEFLSSMSHELRTPMNAILGFAQLLQRDKRTPLSPGQREKLEHVLQGGEHLLKLIDDVLDLSRIEAGRVMVSPERIAVANLLTDVQQTLEPMARRAGIRLLVTLPPVGFPDALADLTRCKQILINFGSNAVKYGRPNGSAQIHAELEGGQLQLLVRDDGIGIPTEKQSKIFQPFQRAGQESGPIEGTGIGLSIAKRLAELMNGSVGFRSRPGEGSEFWLQIPRHALDASEPAKSLHAPPASLRPEAAGTAAVIVYIEDNPSNVAFMRGVVEELPGVRLVSVPSAEQGIDVVRELRPAVVLMDINLPGISGYEATQQLRQHAETKDIPVIALTAAAMLRERRPCAEAGFVRYLTKPVKVAELVQTLAPLVSAARSRAQALR